MFTDARAKALKAGRVADGRGLYLVVLPSGTKCWRFNFRWPRVAAGKRQTMSYGTYPSITLSEARERHLEARRALERGENPALLKRRAKQEQANRGADTFRAIAEDWYKSLEAQSSKSWKSNNRRWLDEHVYPAFGDLPLIEIQPAQVLALLNKVSDMPASAEAIRRLVAMVFDYGILHLRAPSGLNPARALRGAVNVPAPVHNPWLKRSEIPAFLNLIDQCDGSRAIQLAVRLLTHTFVRKLELVHARWTEFDLDRAEWLIPANRMKGGLPHSVPLSSQVVHLFRELKGLAGDSEFVFPSRNNPKEPISNSAVNRAFIRMGFKDRVTPHGLRATASSALNESGWNSDVIERQLAHVEGNSVRRAYNHAQYLHERQKMMQSWSDTLDSLAAGDSNVTPIRSAA